MNISIQQAASSIKAYEQWHETIAGNLSAASIPGFKANQFSMLAEEVSKQSQEALNQPGSIMQSYQMPKGSTHLDFSPGPLKNTETPRLVGTAFLKSNWIMESWVIPETANFTSTFKGN